MNNTFYTIEGLNTLIERANAKGYVKSYCMVNGQTEYIKYSKVKEYTDYEINKFIEDCEQEGYECVEITNE